MNKNLMNVRIVKCEHCSNLIFDGKINVTFADVENNCLPSLECDKCGETTDLNKVIYRYFNE